MLEVDCVIVGRWIGLSVSQANENPQEKLCQPIRMESTVHTLQPPDSDTISFRLKTERLLIRQNIKQNNFNRLQQEARSCLNHVRISHSQRALGGVRAARTLVGMLPQ